MLQPAEILELVTTRDVYNLDLHPGWRADNSAFWAQKLSIQPAEANIERPRLSLGNAIGQVGRQENIGTLIAPSGRIEAYKVEVACAIVPLRCDRLVRWSPAVMDVAACVEKMTDTSSDDITATLAAAADASMRANMGYVHR